MTWCQLAWLPRAAILSTGEVQLSPLLPGSAAAQPPLSNEQVCLAQGAPRGGRDSGRRRHSRAGADRYADPGARAHARVLGQARVVGADCGGATAARPAV